MNNTIIQDPKEILTVISNIFYLLPSILLFLSGLYAESTIYFNITIWSSLYHLCFNYNTCIVKNKFVLQFMDFYFSYSGIAIVIVYYIDIYPRKYKIILQSFVLTLILFLTSIDYFNIQNYIIGYSILVFFAAVYLFIYSIKFIKEYFINRSRNICCNKIFKSKFFNNKIINFFLNNRQSPFHIINIVFIIIGIIMFITGFVINTVFNKKEDYWIVHSVWHMLTGLGALFLFTIFDSKINWIFKKCAINKNNNNLVQDE